MGPKMLLTVLKFLIRVILNKIWKWIGCETNNNLQKGFDRTKAAVDDSEKLTARTENTFDICNWVSVPLFRSLRPLFWSICAPFVLFGAHLFIRRSCRRWDCKHLSRIENGSCLDSENAILDLEKSLLHAGSWTQDILVYNSKLPSQPDVKV